jgi:hypothetical protein
VSVETSNFRCFIASAKSCTLKVTITFNFVAFYHMIDLFWYGFSGDYTPEYIVDRCEGTPGALFDFLFENYVDFSLDADSAVSDAASSVSTECNMDISNDMSLADIMRGASRTEFTNVCLKSFKICFCFCCSHFLCVEPAASIEWRGVVSLRFACLLIASPPEFDQCSITRPVIHPIQGRVSCFAHLLKY